MKSKRHHKEWIFNISILLIILTGCDGCKSETTQSGITEAGFINDSTIWISYVTYNSVYEEHGMDAFTSKNNLQLKLISYEMNTQQFNPAIMLYSNTCNFEASFSHAQMFQKNSYFLPNMFFSLPLEASIEYGGYYDLTLENPKHYQHKGVQKTNSFVGVSSDSNWLLMSDRIVSISRDTFSDIEIQEFTPVRFDELTQLVYGVRDSFLITYSLDEKSLDTINAIGNLRIDSPKLKSIQQAYSGELIFNGYGTKAKIQDFDSMIDGKPNEQIHLPYNWIDDYNSFTDDVISIGKGIVRIYNQKNSEEILLELTSEGNWR